MLTKHLHSTDSTNFQQNVAYTYNERGWMLTSSAPLFAMQLYYNTGTNKAYNGNIMYQYWGTPGSLTTNYTYLYDRLNRLNSGASSDHFIERGIAYDMQGNITNLSRVWNNVLADSLVYSYTGNKLVSIIDKTASATGLVADTTNYTYDGNGNLLTNGNTVNTGQNKTYTYNMLNLPQTVTISGGTVTYTYDASGNKLRKQSTTLGNTEYIGGIQYSATITGLPDFIQTEEGRAVPSGTTAYKYYYYLGDNLGNTRITFDSSTGTATTLQKDDYLPFGMEINRSVVSPKNEYLYNKKELQEELGQYDYGARFYDPGVARFTTIDPHGEKYSPLSPYTYVSNNPLIFIDPDGKDIRYEVNSETHTITINIRANFNGSVDDKKLAQFAAGVNKMYSKTLESGTYKGYSVTTNLIATANQEKSEDYYQVYVVEGTTGKERAGTNPGLNTDPKMTLYSNSPLNTVAHEFGHVMGNIDEYTFNDKNGNGYSDPGETTETDPGSIMGNYKIHGKEIDGIEVQARDRHLYKALETADTDEKNREINEQRAKEAKEKQEKSNPHKENDQ